MNCVSDAHHELDARCVNLLFRTGSLQVAPLAIVVIVSTGVHSEPSTSYLLE